jgi:hypothetical protein
MLMCGNSLGEKENLDEETVYQSTSLMDGEDHPIAIFRFKYRSKSMTSFRSIIAAEPIFEWEADTKALCRRLTGRAHYPSLAIS